MDDHDSSYITKLKGKKKLYIYIPIATKQATFMAIGLLLISIHIEIFFQSSKLEISHITNFQYHEILIKSM
jgi:hypothetical protein